MEALRYHIVVFFAVIGPGFITAMVDNDAGGIFTYSQAGAKYGYLPLWTLLPITILLIVTQEMCSRMGAVTGKGLSDLIREEFGLRTTFVHDGRAGARQSDQRDGELRRYCELARAVRNHPLHLRAAGGACGVAAGGERHVMQGGKGVSVRLRGLRLLHHSGHSGEARLERSGHLQRAARC